MALRRDSKQTLIREIAEDDETQRATRSLAIQWLLRAESVHQQLLNLESVRARELGDSETLSELQREAAASERARLLMLQEQTRALAPLVVAGSARVHGIVSHVDGTPAAKLQVVLVQGRVVLGTATSDARGYFAITPNSEQEPPPRQSETGTTTQAVAEKTVHVEPITGDSIFGTAGSRSESAVMHLRVMAADGSVLLEDNRDVAPSTGGALAAYRELVIPDEK